MAPFGGIVGKRWGRAARVALSGATAVALLSIAVPAAVRPSFARPSVASEEMHDKARTGASGADPIITGSVNPRVDAFPLAGGAVDSASDGADVLLPSQTEYDVQVEPKVGGTSNGIGLPLPDAPLPVDMPAPDLATLIGLQLLSEESALGTRLPQAQREAVIRAYEQRGFLPLWIENGAWSPAARAVFSVFEEADSHGLTPARYTMPTGLSDQLEAVARADIALSMAVAVYARDARGGRIDRNKIGTLVMPHLDLPEADAVLNAVFAAGSGAGEVLEGFHPRAPQYHALRRKLIELRGGRDKAPAPIARLGDGPTITVGMRDERVPLIRARLGLRPVDDVEDARLYDTRLAEAVAEFQRERGLPGKGAMNRRTVVALAGLGGAPLPVARVADPGRLDAAIRVNMERWRWFPHDLGERHILVNIPEQDVKVVEGGRTIHRTRGVIGKLATPTPVFSDTMRYIVLNPSWYVPPSILKADFLPGLARDPQYAARRGYEVIRRGKNITVRQPPGPRNALGRVKFMFPNDLAIYLHDTPSRGGFQQQKRALSNGCIRVENPMKLAAIVVGNGWTEERLNRQVGGRERSLHLETPLPIHLTYFTLTVDSEGKIATLPDVYGYDQRMKTALDALDKKAVGL